MVRIRNNKGRREQRTGSLLRRKGHHESRDPSLRATGHKTDPTRHDGPVRCGCTGEEAQDEKAVRSRKRTIGRNEKLAESKAITGREENTFVPKESYEGDKNQGEGEITPDPGEGPGGNSYLLE